MKTTRQTIMHCAALAALLLTAATAWADGAKTLPYIYGFENNDLGAEGWTGDGDARYLISGAYPRNGSYGLEFSSADRGTYLFSPEIDSKGVDYIVSFYYYISYTYNCSMAIGYSTSTNKLHDFSWEDLTLTTGLNKWGFYKKDFPAEAKYIAITAVGYSEFFFDDFTFAVKGFLSPENLAASNVTDHSATLTWTTPSTDKTITGYAYQIKQHDEPWGADNNVMIPALTTLTFGDLLPNTSYDFRIKTLYAEGISPDYTTITILTDCSGSVSLPFHEDFRNGIPCWRIVDRDRNTIIRSWDGLNVLQFYGKGPQYLVSPQIDCPADITVELYYFVTSSSVPRSFQVGYSTTTDDVSAFTWDTEITTTNTLSNKKFYAHGFPADTKHIAVKYISDDYWDGLCIADFSIYVKGLLSPRRLSVTTVTGRSATLKWDEFFNSTGYAYQYKKAGESTWSAEVTTTETSVTLSGLAGNTDYDFRVKTINGNEASIYSTTQFTTYAAPPYEMNFESGWDHWKRVDCNYATYVDHAEFSRDTGIRTKAAHEGNVGFMFYGEDNWPDQYLISPRFDGNEKILVSFYYRVPSNIEETFSLGYSTTTDDKDAFKFTNYVTFNISSWSKYEQYFPAEARYFAIKYTSNRYELYIDDISFEKYSPFAKPTAIRTTDLSETGATLTWDAPADDQCIGYAYQYKKTEESTWSDEVTKSEKSVTLTGLTPNTHYDFRVRAMYIQASYSNYETYKFQTDGQMVDLPYNDGFENGMGCWRTVDCAGATAIRQSSNSYNGNHCFYFFKTTDDQYLLSPHFASGTPKRVSFYYQNFEDYNGLIRVGYTSSKTGNINWIDNYDIRVYDGQWHLYERLIPAEAQYVVICSKKETFALYIDDFSIEPVTYAYYGALTIAESQSGKTAAISGTSTETIDIPTPVTVRGVTYDRTFTADKASTVMLPFAYTCTGDEGGTFYEFAGVTLEGEKYVATMTEAAKTLSANTPYLFLPTQSRLNFTIPEGGVSLCTAGGGYCETTSGNWTFRGSYSVLRWTADTSLPGSSAERVAEIGRAYGFAGTWKDGIAVGDFVMVADGAWMRPMGCYLLWNNTPNNVHARTRSAAEATAPDELPQQIAVRLVGRNGETSTIHNSQFIIHNNPDGWYSIDGRKLPGKPTQKGIYINNGSKVVIK